MEGPGPSLHSELRWTINTSLVTQGAFLSSPRPGHEVRLPFNGLIRPTKGTAGASSHSLRSFTIEF